MLDVQDQNIIDALREGKSDEDIMSEFGVDQEKVDALKGHIENNPEGSDNEVSGSGMGDAMTAGVEEAPQGEQATANDEAPADAPADGEETVDAGEEVAETTDAPADSEAPAEGEATPEA